MASNAGNIYKTIRWVIVIVLIAAIVLMLKRPTPAAQPLAPTTVAAKAQEFTVKLEQLKSSAEQANGGAGISFTSDEVNSFIADASVRAAHPETEQAVAPAPSTTAAAQEGQGQAPPATTVTAAPQALDPATEQEIQSAIGKTQIAFEGDEVIAQAAVQRYGRDIYVTVRGKLGVKAGYLEFTPTGFKIGDLAVPVSMVNEPLQKRLAEPENRDKLKLPDFISDIHVENGELKIVPR
jgi:hypothetical protein